MNINKKKLFNLFKDYFKVYFEFDIDFKLNTNINDLIKQYYNQIVNDFLINQDIDIADILNIDIPTYRNKKSYQYMIEEILLSFQDEYIYYQQLKKIIENLINEKSKNINLKQILSRLSKLICGHIYQLIPKIINDIKNKSSIHYELIKLIDSFIVNDQFCQENFNLSLSNFLELSPTRKLIQENDWQELVNYTTDIYDQLHIKDKNKYLLELDNDNKINQYYGEINYNPHNLNLRDGPIIIYKDKNNKDHVLIGNYGDFHHELLVNNYDGKHYGRGYWYKPCVFIDYKGNLGYTIDDLVNILKNDSRIKKIYLAPEGPRGGKLNRLAHLIK